MKVKICKINVPSNVIVSFAVAILIHFPEIMWIFDSVGFEGVTFDVTVIDVVSEIVFTFLSLLILFRINAKLFNFSNPKIKLSWGKVAMAFVVTLLASRLMGMLFLFLNHEIGIPAIIEPFSKRFYIELFCLLDLICYGI